MAAGALFAAFAAAPVGAAPGPAAVPGAISSAAAGAPADTGTVRVTGRASISVAADRARLRFAVETRADDATAASQANAEAMRRVLEAVRAALGDAGEIATEGYALTPEYRRPEPGEPRGRTIVGYRALNHVAVTVTDLERVPAVLDGAIAAGANRVAQLSFFAGDTREARLEGIRRATQEATEEARTLAEALGRELGSVIEVSVSPHDRGGGPVMRMAMMESADVSTPMEGGRQEVDVTVDVTWRLAPGSR
jgi:hypothetical protein